MRIAVALSGGVDSAVAAVLLKKHNPGATIGAFYMRNWDPQLEDDSGCKSDIDWESAKKTAEILKIPVKRLSFVRQYWSSVFEPTLKTYVSGGTPNPDILCNREIKFGSLYASLLTGDPENKYDLLATGHYCRIREHKSRLWITQATDLLKDQSYFLSMVPNNIIKNVKFPLGTLSKTFVRQIAKDSGLTHVLQRPESMGLCFVGKRTKKFASFLDDYCTIPIFRVISWDHDYREIGTAPGSLTVGQNVRIAGLSSKMYVIIKDVAKRTLIVSASKDHPLINTRRLRARNLIGDYSECNGENLFCSIRSCDKQGARVTSIKFKDDEMMIETETDMFAPSPGQIVVIYKDIGGDVSLYQFRVLRTIGKGAFGTVRAIQNRNDGVVYALKYIDKCECIRRGAVKNVILERNLLAEVNHPLLVNLHYAFQDSRKVFMVLDLMTGGDLKYHLQQTGSFLEEAVRFIASELVCVISFLHENHIVHRDIKPGNILFDFDGHVHLTDFNVAAKIPQDGSRLFAVSGTPAYMAPEVIAKKTGYTATCDWWSLGVVLYELVCGKKPFKGSNRAEMKRNVLSQPLIFRHNVKKCLSENCIDFISSLLDRDPVLRTRRIKTHPWFQDIDWDAVGKKEANPIFVPHPDRCHFALELEAEATELYYTPQSRKNTTNIDCFTETFREFKLSSCHLVD